MLRFGYCVGTPLVGGRIGFALAVDKLSGAWKVQNMLDLERVTCGAEKLE